MFNWFWEFLYGLIKVPLFCIDVIMLVARKLCGIDNIQVEKTVNGELITEDMLTVTTLLPTIQLTDNEVGTFTQLITLTEIDGVMYANNVSAKYELMKKGR